MSTIVTKKEIKLIAVYARVSTALQEDQETIDAQLLEVRKFATDHGYEIVKEYLDQGWSGDMLERPGCDEMRIDAKKRLWEAVLIYDPDRLSRRYEHQMLVISELEEKGIETLFVTFPPVKDINDKMMRGMRGLFAEYERAKIAERFRIGKLSRVHNGNILASEAPYGYTYILNAGIKGKPGYIIGHYEINEIEANNVRDIFRWVADEGLTLRGVVRRLQDRVIMPRKSKRGVWNTSTLSTMLRNETYIGKAHWGASYAVVPDNPLKKEQKYKKNKKTSRKFRPVDEWKDIAVSRIVEDDLFERAGQRLRDNFALMGRNKKNDYLLAGKIWCTCGCRRAGEGPQHGKHLYYRCNDRVHCFPLPRKCLEKGINARIADEMVWQRFREIIDSPELMKAQIERWKKNQKSNSVSNLVIDIESTKKEIAKLKSRGDRYTNAYSEEVITLDKLKGFLSPIKNEIALLEKNLAQAVAEQKPKTNLVLPNDEEIELFAKEVSAFKETLSFEVKKGIMATTLNKVYSTQKSVQVYGVLNLYEIHVNFFSKYCNDRDTKLTNNYVNSFTSYRNRWTP